MAKIQDTSALFTLNQIMRSHEIRLLEEQDVIERRAAEERKAREEAARREAEEIAAKKREEDERKAREEAALREEEARLLAMKLAAVERARIEAETRARIEIMQKAAEHERTIAAMRADAEKKRLERTVMSGLIGAVALFGVSTGVYFGKIKPEHEARLLESSTRIATIQEETDKLRAQIEKNAKKIEETQAQVKKAEEELGGPLPPPATTASVVRPKLPGPPQVKPPIVVNPPKTCLAGDPSCDINGRPLW